MKLKVWAAVGASVLVAVPLSLMVLVAAIFAPGQAQACTFSSPQNAPAGGLTVGNLTLSGEQVGYGLLIIGIANSRGQSVRDARIALMVAMTESSLHNLAYGDRDSLGLFQQRPSQGWGTPQQIMNPVYATNKFFDALDSVPNRDHMSMLDVALAVQHPDPTRYAAVFYTYEPVADALLAYAMASDQTSSTTQTTTTTTSTNPATTTDAASTVQDSCSSTDSGVPGKVIIAPGANDPGRPITPVTLAFLAKVAGIYGHTIICTTGTNHSYLTVNGNVSDHTTGHACDFGMVANGGTNDGPVGDGIMAACLIAAGDPPVQATEEANAGGLYTRYHDGLRIQCIWKTYEGGDHHNHVHIGAAPMTGTG